jgi:hypothetical protein
MQQEPDSKDWEQLPLFPPRTHHPAMATPETLSNSDAHKGGVWLLAMITRLPSLTHEEFCAYWKDKHAPLVAPWLAKHGVLNYRQVLTSLPSHSSPSSP